MVTQIIQFIHNHWLLCTMSILVLGFIVFEEIRSRLSGIPKVSAPNTVLWLNRENAVVIDLRSKAAFSSGHILGAINVVNTEFEQNLTKLEAYKNQIVILVSDQDDSAATIGSKLKNAGFTKVYVLAGGLTSWKDAQLPLSKN